GDLNLVGLGAQATAEAVAEALRRERAELRGGSRGLALQALIRITSFAEFAAEAEHRHKMLDDEPITLTNHPAAYGRPRHRSGAAAQQGCVCSEPCMNRHRSHFEGVLSFVHLFNPPSVPPSPPPPSGTHT
ncbi:unnamed protein product, partial [Prorocentrum cordatum]